MLRDQKFSDIYLGQDNSWLAGVPGTLDPVPAPEDCQVELKDLRSVCETISKETNKLEFAVRHNETAYRASTLKSLTETVYVIRRFPSEIPDVNALGISDMIIKKVMEPGLSGLLLVGGAYTQGKTTTVSALVKGRLSKHGGVGVTIEDPPEMPLEGKHGEGVCYQTWVEQGGFGGACRQAARWAPSIIYIGEIRDGETASEAIKASINGRLVVGTIHADSVQSVVERIFTLAVSEGGNPDDIANLLSSGLLGVLHQKLDGEPKKPSINSLWFRGEEETSAKNIVRTKKFEQLASVAQLQKNRMMHGGK